MSDFASLKHDLWEVVKSSVSNPNAPNAMEDFFRLDAELETMDYTCYLSPMHRKVTTCLTHLKDWKYIPGGRIPKEGLSFVQEAFWILERSEKAKSYLYGAFFIASKQSIEDYGRLSNRLVATAYEKLLPNAEPRIYAKFVEFTRLLSEVLAEITFYTDTTKEIDAKRLIVMMDNFLKHVKRYHEDNADRMENSIAQLCSTIGEINETEIIESLLAINENCIGSNYWGSNYPIEGGKISQFIANLWRRSSEGHKEDLVRLIKLLGDRMYYLNRMQPDRKVKPIKFTTQQKQILEAAIAANLYEETTGRLVWKETQVLHDYFLGKLFCGDCVIEHSGRYDWNKIPRSKLPVAQLCALIDGKDIGRQRSSRETAPDGYEKIDNLFKNLAFNAATKTWEDKYNR